MAPTVALYLRISKSDVRTRVRPGATPEEIRAAAAAEALTSLEKQRRNCTAAARHDYPGAAIVEFTDDGVSASKKRRRAALDELRDGVRAGRFVAVVVDTIDRLTRDRGARAMWDLAEDCETAGAVLFGASQSLDLTTAGGEMQASALAMGARFEARRNSDRVKATNILRASQGYAPAGGPAPWGLVKEGKGYAPDEREIVGHDGTVTTRAEVVRAGVAAMLAGTASTRSLEHAWTVAGWPTPYGASSRWGGGTVGKILRAPALAGMIVRTEPTAPGEVSRRGLLRGDDGLPIVHPGALIDVSTWHELQAVLAARSTGRRPASPSTLPTPRREYPLLHGLARDHEGHVMYQHWTKGRPGRYVCRTVGCALHTAVLLDGLDEIVEAAWLEERGDEAETETVTLREATDPVRLLTIRREIRATAALLGTETDDDVLDDLSRRLRRLRAAERVAEAEEGRRGLSTLRETGRTMGDVWRAADTDGRRALLEESIDAVLVAPGLRGRPGGQARPIEPRVRIVWTWDPYAEWGTVPASLAATLDPAALERYALGIDEEA